MYENELTSTYADVAANKASYFQTPMSIESSQLNNSITATKENQFVKPISDHTKLPTDDNDIIAKCALQNVVIQRSTQMNQDALKVKPKLPQALDSDNESYDLNRLVYKKQNSSTYQTKPRNGAYLKQSLKLPSRCKNLLIGDSNLKNVKRRQLDSSGQTHVRTYRGCHVESLTRIIDNSEFEYPSVQKVSFCVGTNDCQQPTIDEEVILHKLESLVKTSKSVFPNASIAINAIPPQGRAKVNTHIAHLNTKIANLCRHNNIKFLSCDSLWTHVSATTGQIDQGLILPDGIHFHNTGLGLFLKNTKAFFQLNRHRFVQRPHTSIFKNSLYNTPETFDQRYYTSRSYSFANESVLTYNPGNHQQMTPNLCNRNSISTESLNEF